MHYLNQLEFFQKDPIHEVEIQNLNRAVFTTKENQILIRMNLENPKETFENLKAVCDAAGGTTNDLVKVNIFLIDLGHFATVNEIMSRYFNKPYPARAAVQVSALPMSARIEIEAVGFIQ